MGAGRINRMVVIWVLRHIQVALASLGRLSRAPLPTLLTSTVIGIALALPAAMQLVLVNVQDLSGRWDGASSISLFLKTEADDKSLHRLAVKLQQHPMIQQVDEINREEALREFSRHSGFSGALEALDVNPLPNVLVVTPTANASGPAQAAALVKELEKLQPVEFAQLDLQWVKRFHAFTLIARRGVMVLGGLLGLAVLLIVGNTIRLEIQGRHAEIEITKLIGGTDAFIRRPFLYTGFWYGLCGGIIAWLMITLSLSLLDAPVARLSGLYQSGFQLSGLSPSGFIGLLSAAALLGLGGSWIAVGRHLSQIEPS
ncbi:MAG: ABC transporter permease [Gammaproteobacteria bacterium]|nr:ABC transporter permease [Gammaproteobacteria bacterium]